MSEEVDEEISAAGGIVFRFVANSEELEILLIFRNGVWDLPKGKLEEGEVLEMCAVREVAEEVGSSLPAIVSKIGTTYHEYQEGNKLIGKTTYWYSMLFTKNEKLEPQQEEGIQKIEWYTLSKAIEKAGYDNLRQIMKKFNDKKKAQ
ncbi:MAG: NUDIX domain-containing protein [Balneolaceae bacterium]